MADQHRHIGGKSSDRWFVNNYKAAREQFLALAADVTHSRVISKRVGAERDLLGPDGEELCIDFLIVHSPEDEKEPKFPTSVFVHSSGVHGPEGFVGSAIQRDWVANFPVRTQHRLPKGHIAVFIHAVNPFGMAWWHRFNENNVDLNRNCIVIPGTARGDSARFTALQAEPNADYVVFNSLINPSFVGIFDCFLLRAGAMIAWFGMGRMKQAAVGGQYSFPHGMYFGGFELQEGVKAVLSTLLDLGVSRKNANLRTFVHIDVHSGLGPSGIDTLLLDGGQPEHLIRRIAGFEGEDALPGAAFETLRVQGSTPGGLAYDTAGSFTSATMLLAGTQHPALLPQLVDTPPHTSGWEDLEACRQAAETAQPAAGAGNSSSAAAASRARSTGRTRGKGTNPAVAASRSDSTPLVKLSVTQEFGTLEPLEVFQSVRSLNCKLAEQPDLPMSAPERAQSLGAFYVDTPEWKHSTLTRGRDVLARFWAAAAADQEVLLTETV